MRRFGGWVERATALQQIVCHDMPAASDMDIAMDTATQKWMDLIGIHLNLKPLLSRFLQRNHPKSYAGMSVLRRSYMSYR